MFIRQLSIFVENKKGGLAEILTELGNNNIDICALSLADSTDFGILRLIVDDEEKAEQILTDHGVVVKVNQVLGLAVDDTPGGLAKALSALDAGGHAIEYMYSFVGENEKHAMAVLRTDDNQKALETLRAAGVSILAESDIRKK
ncbi:MAG: ACT domain-containing protein [Clostridia bacterium]|nr:ACT domain-containing protein [Clostridia bacterium]